MKSVDKKVVQKTQQPPKHPTAEDVGLFSVVSLLRSMSIKQEIDSKNLLNINNRVDSVNKNILISLNKLQSQASYSLLINNGIQKQNRISLAVLEIIQNIDDNLFTVGKIIHGLPDRILANNNKPKEVTPVKFIEKPIESQVINSEIDKLSFENSLINSIQSLNNVLLESLETQKKFYDYYQLVNDPEKLKRVDNEIADSKLFKEGLNLANRWFQKDVRTTANKNEFIFTDKSESTIQGFNNLSNLINTTNTLLSELVLYSRKIYDYLPYLTSNPEESRVNKDIQSSGIDLTYLISGIKDFDKSLSAKFLKNFRSFNIELNKLLGIESKKFLYTKISLSALAITFKLISDQASGLSSAFRSLTFSIILVSLALISPPFLLGATVLIGILYGIRKALTGTSVLFGWNLKKLSLGILTLVASFWLMAKLPMESLMKAIAIIGMLALAIRVFGGNHTMSFKSKTSGIFGLAMGVLALSLAFGAFGDVSFTALIKMIGFITLLGFAIRAFPVGNRTKGMFGFSLSLVLMTLSIAAFGELPVANMLTMLAFITGLGLVFRVFPIGNRMKGMLGFAFGMTLLVLAVEAAGEVPLTSYMFFLGFVAALLGEIVFFNRLNKGPMSGMFGLSLGLAILVLAVDASREVPFSAYANVLMFVGGLLTIISLYNKQGFTKTSGLFLIAGFVAAMAISFSLLEKVGLQISTVLSFVTGLSLVSGIILFLGNPKYIKNITIGAKNLMIIAGATAIGVLVLGYVSSSNINLNNIFNFVLSISMVTGLVFVIGKLEKEIGKGSIVLTIISVAMMIGAIAINIISSTNIDIINVLKFVGSLVALGGVSALFGIPAVSGLVITGSVVILAMTAMLGLSMLSLKTISSYKIDFNNVFRFIGSIGILASGLTLLIPLTVLGMVAVTSLNLMLLGLIPAAIMMFTISNIKTNIGNIALLLGGIGILAAGISLLSPLIVIGGIAAIPLMVLLSTCLLGSLLLSTMSFTKINFKSIGLLIGTITLLATTFAILSPVMLLSGIGAILMLPVVATSLLIATTLSLISGLSYENVGAFLLAIVGLATSYALITPLAVIGLIGATLTMPIMLAALWTAAVMKSIMELKLSNEGLESFNKGLSSIITTINNIGLIELTKSAAKSILLLPIMTSMLLASTVLFAISKLELSQKNITIFNYGLTSIVDSINGFGVISLTKGAAKAVLLLPIMTSMLLASLVLKAISELEIDPKKMDTFGTIINSFTDTILEGLSKNTDKLIKAEAGMSAFSKLINIPSGLVTIVQQMANMRFNEYEAIRGKMVLKKVREFNKDDFERVGVNLAAMLNALIEPLTIMGGTESTFKIAGVELSNPFTKSKSSKGVEFLNKLGSAFKPLVEGIDMFAKLELSKDIKQSDLFVQNLMILVNGFNNVFEVLSKTNTKKATMTVTKINEFLDTVSDIKIDEFKAVNNEVDKFTTNLSQKDRWDNINKNLINLKNNFLSISKAINSIDLKKATALNRSLTSLGDKNTNDNLRKLVEEFAELIGLIKLEQENSKSKDENNNQSQNKTIQILNNEQPVKKVDKKNDTIQIDGVMGMLGELSKILLDIKDATQDTSSTLSEPLKVVSASEISNFFGG